MVFLPEGAIVVKKEEIEAMNTYSNNLKREHIKEALNMVEELLQMAIKTEDIKAKLGDSHTHNYANRLCHNLLDDIRKIERQFYTGIFEEVTNEIN